MGSIASPLLWCYIEVCCVEDVQMHAECLLEVWRGNSGPLFGKCMEKDSFSGVMSHVCVWRGTLDPYLGSVWHKDSSSGVLSHVCVCPDRFWILC